MAKRHEKVILRGDLEANPAVVAWRRLHGGVSSPESIEILQREKGGSAAVYRIGGIGPSGSAVIAKGRRAGELEIPRRLYAEVLPDIAVPTLACYGFVPELDGRSWLFLEDAGDERYSQKVERHRTLAAEWLAALHSSAVAGIGWLPRRDFGPELLQTAQHAVRGCLRHPALTSANVDTLDSILRRLHRAEDRWPEVETAGADLPESLVHGDFIAKNIRVRRLSGRVELVGLDWDSAGRATPVYELGVLPRGEDALRAYHARAGEGSWRPSWPELVHLKGLSDLYWAVTFVEWETRSFRYESIESAMRRMDVYDRWLRAGVGAFASTGSRA